MLFHFTNFVKELDQPKLYQVLMDGPSVNLKFYDELNASLTKTVNQSLINIGTWSFHVVHSSYKNGEAATQWIT